MSALVGFPNVLRLWLGGTAPSIGTFAISATNSQIEFIFQVPPNAITITRLGIRQSTLTGTSPVYRLSLQGVDASGNPDGVIKNSSTCKVDWTPTAGQNATWYWQNLDASFTTSPTTEKYLSAVISYLSGTINASNNVSFAMSSGVTSTANIPYAIQNNAGTRTRQAANPLWGFGSSSTAYGMPLSSASNAAFSSAGSPDEKALLLTMPTYMCSTYKISGVELSCTLAAAGGFDLILYDTDGTTVLQQTSYDTDVDRVATASGTRFYYFDDVPVTLNAGSTYYLSFVPTTGTLNLPAFAVANAADLDAWPYGQAVASSASRTNAGAWTTDNLTRYGINPILSDVTQAAGGGLLYIPNLEGV